MTWPAAVLTVVALSGDASPPPETAARLTELVRAIRLADYRGDRQELQRLSMALDGVKDARLRAYAAYWQGFAQWRRAVNGLSETPTPPDLDADLEAGVRAFRAAGAERPGWIEAKIGIVGCYSGLLFLTRDDPARQRAVLSQYVPVAREVAAGGDDNPRALWLAGGTQLGAPPPHGGDAAKALATFQRALAAARREAEQSAAWPDYVPSWGGAENLMSLAYLYSHSALESPALARAYAEGALVAAPQWRYVREVLMPQIRERPAARP